MQGASPVVLDVISGALLHTVLFLLAVALAVLVAGSLLEKMAEKQEAHCFACLTVLAGAISTAIHELQKERAESAAFSATGGRVLRREMEAQRALADQALDPLRLELERVRAADGPRLTSAIEAARSGLDRLAAERGGSIGSSRKPPRWPNGTNI